MHPASESASSCTGVGAGVGRPVHADGVLADLSGELLLTVPFERGDERRTRF